MYVESVCLSKTASGETPWARDSPNRHKCAVSTPVDLAMPPGQQAGLIRCLVGGVPRSVHRMFQHPHAAAQSTLRSKINMAVFIRLCSCIKVIKFCTVLQVIGFPPRLSGFEPRSGLVGFVVDNAALGQVFSRYFYFRCQFSFHRLRDIHHPGLVQQAKQWPPYRLDSVSPHLTKLLGPY
jgi:hypothetical protein